MKIRLPALWALSSIFTLSACSAPTTDGTVIQLDVATLNCAPAETPATCISRILGEAQPADRLYLATRENTTFAFLFWHKGNDSLDAEKRLDSAAVVARYRVPAKTGGPAWDTSTAGTAVVSVVNVPSPWYAPGFVVAGRMRDAVPEYAVIDGLDFKYFTMSKTGTLGGVYLWQNRRAADTFYDEAWHQRIKESYGKPADLQFFNATSLQLEEHRGTASDD